jgi:hypothetical protein
MVFGLRGYRPVNGPFPQWFHLFDIKQPIFDECLPADRRIC